MKSTCVLASAGLPAPPGRHCCCPACAHRAVADALVLMQTGRALAERPVLEALEEDLSQVAALTRRWAAPSSRASAQGKPSWADVSESEGCAVASVPAADVEGAVLDQVQKLLTAPELIARTWAVVKPYEDRITEREVTILLADFATV